MVDSQGALLELVEQPILDEHVHADAKLRGVFLVGDEHRDDGGLECWLRLPQPPHELRHQRHVT